MFLAAATASGAVLALDARTLEHQGVARHYLVANAEAAKDGPRPLFIALHGRREPNQPNTSSPQLDALARREGFVAIYPAAMEGMWNFAGRAVMQSRAGAEIADDLGFLGKLIDRLIADKIADQARVYLSGTSNGGFMAYSIACLLPDKVAAVAPMLAGMIEGQLETCKPPRTVPILVIAGTNDRVVPYDGGLFPAFRVTSVPETMEFWRRRHGCTGQKSTMMPHRLDTDTTRTLVVEWTGCAIDGGLKLLRVEGGGHILPSFSELSPENEQRWGRRSHDFETSEEVWSFFRKFSR